MSWFTFAWTFIYLVGLGVALIFVPALYNYWAHLYVQPCLDTITHHSIPHSLALPSVLEILTNIFWIVTFGLLADHAADLASLNSTLVFYGFTSQARRYLSSLLNGLINATYGAAGAAGVEWMSFNLTLVFLSKCRC
jgi:hypothetical protein